MGIQNINKNFITGKAMNVREENNNIEVIKQIAESEMRNMNLIAL